MVDPFSFPERLSPLHDAPHMGRLLARALSRGNGSTVKVDPYNDADGSTVKVDPYNGFEGALTVVSRRTSNVRCHGR